jgi:hypothetical protein
VFVLVVAGGISYFFFFFLNYVMNERCDFC